MAFRLVEHREEGLRDDGVRSVLKAHGEHDCDLFALRFSKGVRSWPCAMATRGPSELVPAARAAKWLRRVVP